VKARGWYHRRRGGQEAGTRSRCGGQEADTKSSKGVGTPAGVEAIVLFQEHEWKARGRYQE
jgi:hypothetical protein